MVIRRDDKINKNQYFTNIGPRANKIPQDNKCPTINMDYQVLESMIIAPGAEW